MHSPAVAFLFALITAVVVNAHFQLQFPAPRGVFNMDNEPTFCDGYLDSVSNRTEFPLSGGFYSLNSEHTQWVVGVLISTLDNPQSFNNFSQVNSFFQDDGEGLFCFPLDFATSNVTSLGLKSGDNVTIQIVFDGGDGQLYQCADLTLSDNFNISSSVSCTNATGSTTTTSTSPSATSSTTTSSAMSNYLAVNSAIGILFAVVGLALA
ncbi:hypothetical protein HYPSUDRAFT_133890 [Hypholoma sublateritium FD-334 SS-4]|uniref:Copper acquisition factor BIM1-like domain-containing protein n=1 Tax=Hypholoma sublateritium (strain FD-334 SS-4) TaxID=945553 RepID=A0A0D2Q320_HYPSF|nr:hypothetical protein HYPSUDRAFT_133890 [Hypholoma sublateritium FD-334 SS-4]